MFWYLYRWIFLLQRKNYFIIGFLEMLQKSRLVAIFCFRRHALLPIFASEETLGCRFLLQKSRLVAVFCFRRNA